MYTYRLEEHQRSQLRRYFVRSMATLGVLPVGFLIIGRFGTAFAFLVMFIGVVVLVSGTARFAFTTVDDEGIRSRAFFLPRQTCPWSQVVAIEVAHNRAAATTVRVTRADGTRFSLGAPMTSPVMVDLAFEAKTEKIRDAWKLRVPEERRPPLASRRAEIWRRGALVATATLLWVGVPFMLLGAFLVAREDTAGSAQDVHIQAVVVAVDTSYDPPVYQLDAVMGSTFPASKLATSSTEAFCAIIDSGTRVGDTVKLVYPRSDPEQMEEEKPASSPWHEALVAVVVTMVGAAVIMLIRRWLTRTHRLRR